MSQDEQVDIVDEINNIQFQTSKYESHKKGLLHRVVIGAVHTSDGRICLIKQASDRQDAGQYVCPVGGHVSAGESEESALLREALEEIGTNEFKFKLLGRAVFNREVISRKENHYFNVFRIIYDGELVLNEESVDYEYFTPEQLDQELINQPQKFGDAFKFVYENFFN